MSFQIGTEILDRPARSEPAKPVRRDEAIASAYAKLRDELTDAILTDPARHVQTPGFAQPTWPAEECVRDHFDGKNGDADYHELMQILSAGVRGESVQLRCMALLSKVARVHGEFHAADLVDGEEV